MTLALLLGIYAVAVGLVVGSYLNVVIHRLPRRLSTVLPRSRCPACGAAIAARDNLPVVSYLVLRGRCRHCASRISPRYVAVEALTGLLFLACYVRFGASVEALIAALFCALMVALAGIDLEHYLLPDRITLPGIAAGVALAPWASWNSLLSALGGAALGGGVLLALWGTWYLLRGEEGMGLGDVKMLAMVGAFLGWMGALVTLFFGAVLGAAVGLALVGRGAGGLKTRLPFGVFLAVGGVVALFVGPALVRWYLTLF